MRFKFKKCLTLLGLACLFVVILTRLSRSASNRTMVGKSDQNALPDNRYHEAVNQNRKDSDFGFDTQKGRKIDWHDQASILADQQRTGAGEQGVAVHIDDKERGSNAYSENGFNIFVSNRISLNRSLPDIRHPNCKTRKYLSHLPNTSVIIPFHNEGWSTLLRTVHSIINRTPPSLLHEIILVDDYSAKEHLKSKLEEELKKYPKVKLFRTGQREGLIRARLTGVNHATGQVVLILDSHVEVTHNWLPPLLEPIAMDRRVVTCPMIDIVDKDDFHYLTQPGDAMRGAFDWELYYKRIPIPPEKQPQDPSDPFEDPVMAGGLFAVNRLYFLEIGQYDPGLEIWGGEQYELSFKVWMCGGRILDAPCSRVGHIYRKFMPYSLPKGTNINKNFKRVVEVWMDEYKEYFYKKRPYVRNIDPGPLEKQKNLRESLQCKSFDWFMKQVAPDIFKHYPPVMPEPAAWGTLINEGTGFCMDTSYRPQGGPVQAEKCQPKGKSEQEFLLTWKEDIRPGADMESARRLCVDGQGLGRPLIMWECHGQYGNQLWKYKSTLKQLYHAITGLCAGVEENSKRIFLMPCKDGEPSQQWTWKNVDLEKLKVFNKHPNVPA
uniref:Polypeptide N-acetylgalactosaminyltransferase n=1 Tax=Phallusia mammillata TaxID=59560 RepID=A0A6F9DE51_9ASCI|nr:polypeptide N-acetylgalactosaminyltransferase-like 6 [Phallusia mammillata]